MYKTLFKIFPWVLLLLVGVYFYLSQKSETVQTIESFSIVNQISSLGKLELAKYHTQDIVELKNKTNVANLFNLESKAVLIAVGETVGCIDLTKVKEENIRRTDTIVYITLPKPEICYSKIDMNKTHLYDLEEGIMGDAQKMVDKVYKQAALEIETSALQNGILKETEKNANLYLKNFLQATTGLQVVINFRLEEKSLDTLKN